MDRDKGRYGGRRIDRYGGRGKYGGRYRVRRIDKYGGRGRG